MLSLITYRSLVVKTCMCHVKINKWFTTVLICLWAFSACNVFAATSQKPCNQMFFLEGQEIIIWWTLQAYQCSRGSFTAAKLHFLLCICKCIPEQHLLKTSGKKLFTKFERFKLILWFFRTLCNKVVTQYTIFEIKEEVAKLICLENKNFL